MEKILDRNIDLGPYVPQPDDDIIICRCEEVTKGEIRQAVHDGMWDLNEIRRYLRTGMGLCQGKTCGRLVQQMITRQTGQNPAEVLPMKSRMPARPVKISSFGGNE